MAIQNEAAFLDVITKGDDAQLTRLLEAVDGDEPLVATIESRRASNHAIGFGMTLLQFAALRERKGGAPAKLLIARGATVDLHSACGLGMLEQIDSLLRERPESVSDQVDTYYPLQFAITAGRAEVVHSLMGQGDDANRDLRKVAYFGWEDDALGQDYLPWRPIHMASLWSFTEDRIGVVRALTAAGADLNALSPLDGFRPIHLVAMPNRVEMIKYFVAEGVDVDSRTKACSVIDLPNEDGPLRGYECTPLMVAAAEGFPEATACLLELGADPMAENDQGDTALDFAEKRFWKGQPYDDVVGLLKTA